MTDQKTHALVCSVCKKPRLIAWSGKWTAPERLFLIAMTLTIQRIESSGHKKRSDPEWRQASTDEQWMMVFACSDGITDHIADMIVDAFVELNPDATLEKWFKQIEGRFNNDQH
jgi:hypothetical protein